MTTSQLLQGTWQKNSARASEFSMAAFGRKPDKPLSGEMRRSADRRYNELRIVEFPWLGYFISSLFKF